MVTRICGNIDFSSSVPFEIHQSSGVVTIPSGPEKDWKPTYNLEVVAVDDSQEISTPVTIHITKDPQDDANLDLFTDRLIELPETLEYSVLENAAGEGLSGNNITSFSQTHVRSFVV